MTVTVSVDASWRMSRVEFQTPHGVPGVVQGVGEVLLQEPAKPSDGAEILRAPNPFGSVVPASKTYGTLPGALVSRPMSEETMAETIEVDGKTITFGSVVDSIKTFMEKWRAEDAAKPPVTLVSPQAAELTPMPEIPTSSLPRE